MWYIVDIMVVIYETILYYWLLNNCFSKRSSGYLLYIELLVFPLATVFFQIFDVPTSIKTVFILLIGIIMVLLIYDCKIKNSIFVNVTFIMITIVSESIVMGILICFNDISDISVFLEHTEMRFQCIIFSKMIHFILVFLCIKLFSHKTLTYSFKEIAILILQIMEGVLCLTMVVEFSRYQIGCFNLSFIYLSILSIIIFIAFIVSFSLTDRYFTYKKKEKEQMIIDSQNDKLFNYYKNLESSREEVLCMYHDMKKHLNTLNLMNNTENESVYLEQCMEKVRNIDGEFYTGNRIVDIILYEEWVKASKLGINSKFIVEENSLNGIELPVITTILGNALENAREACLRCNEECIKKSFINLKVFNDGSNIIIVTSNSYVVEPKWNGNELVSTKKDNHMHGIGVKSIKRVIAKYNGELKITANNGKYIMTILLSNC